MHNTSFQDIHQAYDSFYKELLKQGKMPFGSTETGFWGHVPAHEIYEAFGKLKLPKNSTLVDLGSGDGKVVHIASLFCKHAVGVELDADLVDISKRFQERLKIPNVTFTQADFFNHDVSPYDFVFVYPDVPFHRGLDKKMKNELRGSLIHFGHHFQPNALERVHAVKIAGTPVSIYRQQKS